MAPSPLSEQSPYAPFFVWIAWCPASSKKIWPMLRALSRQGIDFGCGAFSPIPYKRDSRSVALLHYAEQGGEVWSRAIFRYGMVEIEGF